MPNTKNGKDYEKELETKISNLLKGKGYSIESQVPTLEHFGKKRLDILATKKISRTWISKLLRNKESFKIPIEIKYQEVQGTAEEKIPFDAISLINYVNHHKDCKIGYIVLGGNGFSSKIDEFINGTLKPFIKGLNKIQILREEQFLKEIDKL